MALENAHKDFIWKCLVLARIGARAHNMHEGLLTCAASIMHKQ